MRAQTAQDIVPIEGLWDALNKEDKIVNSCLPVFGLTMKRGLVERHYYEFINATPNSRGWIKNSKNLYLFKDSCQTHHCFEFLFLFRPTWNTHTRFCIYSFLNPLRSTWKFNSHFVVILDRGGLTEKSTAPFCFRKIKKASTKVHF